LGSTRPYNCWRKGAESAANGGRSIWEESPFEDFYAAHRLAVAKYVRRRVDDVDSADIIAQVFSVAWRRFDVVPAPPEDRLWLFGVALRMVADYRRSTVRRSKLRHRLAGEPSGPTLPANFELLQSQVEAAMGSLRPAERDILRLVVWDELSHAEASSRLGCSPNALEIRYRRARAHFRAAFLAHVGSPVAELPPTSPVITVRPPVGPEPQ
jgi:RNA polymerase sigma factor (sigma-70 family)